MNKEIEIQTDYITLGQFLKIADIIPSGGMSKWYLQEHEVLVNDEKENRRGRKLRHQDVIIVPTGTFIISKH